MSFVKNIKDLFIVSDDENDKTSSASKVDQVTEQSNVDEVAEDYEAIYDTQSDGASENEGQSKQNYVSEMEEQNIPTEGKVDKRFVDILMNVLSENNLEGYDYFEFKQALRKLRDIEPDEEKRFKSAYFAVQSLGVSPNEFLESGKYYLSLLEREEGKFKDSLKAQMQAQVYTKQKELDEFDVWMQKKEAEIKRIKQEIADRKQQNQALASNIKTSEQKIKKVELNFTKTYTTLVDEINADLDKIRKYLS